MRAGLLRRRVTIEARSDSVGSFGQSVPTWSVYAASVPAHVTPMRGSEKQRAAQTIGEVSHRVVIRYSSEVSAVSTKHRLKYQNRYFDIQAVLNVNRMNRTLELWCLERGAAPRFFNGSIQTLAQIPLLDIVWPMGVMFPTTSPTWWGDGLDETHFRNYVAALPAGIDVCFDLEGAYPVVAVYGQEHWEYDIHPDTAVSYRVEALQWAKSERPDLRFGLYGIPEKPFGDDAYDLERETAYKAVSSISDDLYIPCYPNTALGVAGSKARVDARIQFAKTIHGHPTPRILVSYETNGGTWTASEFAEIIDHVQAQGCDCVFWISASADPVPDEMYRVMLDRV